MSNFHVHPSARIGVGVKIGIGTSIGAHAEIGDRTVIGDHCTIAAELSGADENKRLVIGEDSLIRSHTVLYEGSEFGAGLQTGHHTLIREGTRAGRDLRIGSYSDIEGHCTIGDCGRFHGYAHVGRGSSIGNFVHLYSLTILLNDPLPPSNIIEPAKLDDGVVVAVGATVMPGTHMRLGSFAASRSVVSGVVPAGAVVEGPQGRIVTHVTLLTNLQKGLRHPWTRNFADRYPEWAQPRLKALEEAIVATRAPFVQSLQSDS